MSAGENLKPDELCFTKAGGVELVSVGGHTLWASDSDEAFHAQFPDPVSEEDLPAIDDYLIEKGLIAPGTELWISDESPEAGA